MANTRTASEIEDVKRASRGLRGSLADEMSSESPSVSEESAQLLKFHGVYAQDDRDVRRARVTAGLGLHYIFMTRVVVPGGRLSARQWLALDEVADVVGNGSIRLTTRQAVQIHGTAKVGLQQLARRIDSVLLTSFGGCGDQVRNVAACPGLHDEPGWEDLDHVAHRVSLAFRPTTTAYWEIFVEGERAASADAREHAFYGDAYLPRKFKIGLAHPRENCVDVFTHDVGLVPTIDAERGRGLTLLVGGGLGRSYAAPETFSRLASALAFLSLDEVVEVLAAVVDAYKDLGDRDDRKRARLKYVVERIGVSGFRAEVERRLGRSLTLAPRELPRFEVDDHLGWRRRPDGTWCLGVRVPAGRVRDDGGVSFKTALRLVAERFDPELRITPLQDVIIDRVAPEHRDELDALLESHGVRPPPDLGPVERTALACPALPTCGLALTEAERALPGIVAALESELDHVGLSGRRLQLRVTGCPNGCARPAVAEVGLVGRTKSSYDLFIGGTPRGDRLARLYREKVAGADVASVLSPLLARWRDEAEERESFGDFVHRRGLA